MLFEHKSVPPGFCDSAITELIAKSSKLRHFRKSSQIFGIAAIFLQILGVPWCHRNTHSVKVRLFLSLKNWMNSLAFSSCSIYKSYIGKRTESRTNLRYSFGLCGADRLSARARAGCSRSRDIVMYSAGRYSEESSRIHRRINNILWEAFKFGTEFC